MKIFALIPAFNEQKTVGKVIKECKKAKLVPIVVDDGSFDKTYEIAKKSGAIVLRHKINKGKGEAVKTGLNYVLKKMKENDAIILIDADFAYSPKESKKLIEPIKNGKADFVMGFRNWKKVPFRHKLGNLVWRKVFNFFFKTNFKDTNCGFVAMNKKAAKIMKKAACGGYILESSMLIEALKRNLKIAQENVNVKYHKKSGFLRGIRIVVGVLIFMLLQGLKYRLKI